MNKLTYLLIPILCLLLSVPVLAANTGNNFATQLRPYQKSAVAAPFFKHAYGYAFFPTVGKGGIGIGGAYGRGRVYRKGRFTGTVSLFKVSIGFQLGGQAFSELIFFRNKRAYDEFTNGTFELDASASAVAITAGAQATAGTAGTSAGVSAGPQSGKQLASNYVNGSAIFIHTRGGLMYEASVGGQTFKFQPRLR